MGSGFEHTALAVFTTLAPMAAASFLVVAYVFLAGKPDADATKRLDKWTVLPAAVLLVGFIGAFLHLANPLNAFGVFSGIGASPLSNEVVAGVIFGVIALLYWILALTGKLSLSVRKVFLVVLSVLALVFAVLCGMAYMMPTIPTWDTPMSIVQMVGYAVAGGAVLGFTLVGLARVELPANAPMVALVLAVVGVLIAAVGFGVQIAGLGEIHNIWGSADQLVPAIWALFAVFVVCGLVSAGLVYVALKKGATPALLVVACVIVAVGIFFARIGFYGLFMGIAL